MTAGTDGKIVCQIDGALTHSIEIHIQKNHPDWTLERYRKEFPGAPLLSEKAKLAVLKNRQEKEAKGMVIATEKLRPMHEVFGFPAEKALNALKKPIMVQTFKKEDWSEIARDYIPDIDPNYVFNIELTKTTLIGYQLNMPMYFWGMHGTGKTTQFEQVAARTGRPFMRVQHTINTEEAHILGQYVVSTDDKGNAVTNFQLGPLPIAMLNGMVYCADEYDQAIPAVCAVYQAVLEGKPLIIKEAPPELRVIRPHREFRLVATGNTNGSGDETGLYQGTQIQNAANYSRFRITEEVHYTDPKIEAAIIAGQAKIRMDEANKLVKVATEIRKAFQGGQVSAVPSTRELITAASLGAILGGEWREGLRKAFMNRLSRTDRETVDQYCQRVFG